MENKDTDSHHESQAYNNETVEHPDNQGIENTSINPEILDQVPQGSTLFDEEENYAKSYNSEPYQSVSDLEDMRYPDEELSGGEWLTVTRKKHKRISIQRGKVSLTTPPGPLFRKPLTRSRSLLLQQIFNQGKYVVGIFGGLTNPLNKNVYKV